jgi:FkbM family methyltransferase
MNPFFAQTKVRIIKLYECLINPAFRQALFRHGVAAEPEHRHLLGPDLATVVDIGANRGQFTLAVRRWAPQARVVAFEPLPEPADRFRKVFRGDSRVTLHRVAIGPEAGDVTIHVSGCDDSSSVLPIGAMQERLFPGTGEVRTETVPMGRLSDFVSAEEIVFPAMLKLDVQGFELEALRGCEDLLECFACVYAECSFVELYSGQALAHDVIEWLARHGFILTGVYNLCCDKKGKAVQGDFLFTKVGGLTAD